MELAGVWSEAAPLGGFGVPGELLCSAFDHSSCTPGPERRARPSLLPPHQLSAATARLRAKPGGPAQGLSPRARVRTPPGLLLTALDTPRRAVVKTPPAAAPVPPCRPGSTSSVPANRPPLICRLRRGKVAPMHNYTLHSKLAYMYAQLCMAGEPFVPGGDRGEATAGRQLHAPGRLRHPLEQLTKPCNLTPLEALWEQPAASYSTWTVRRKRTVNERSVGRRNGPPERPERPGTASDGGAEPSTCALSGGKPCLRRGSASRCRGSVNGRFRLIARFRSCSAHVFEPV